jgi:hypothetical protein
MFNCSIFLYGCILNFQHEADVIIIIEKNCALLSTHFFFISRILFSQYYILPVGVFNFFSKTISGFDLL